MARGSSKTRSGRGAAAGATATRRTNSTSRGSPARLQCGKASESKRSVTRGHSAVIAEPSEASAASRGMERIFALGIAKALRKARAKRVAVTILDGEGRLVRGLIRERRGRFSLKDAVVLID